MMRRISLLPLLLLLTVLFNGCARSGDAYIPSPEALQLNNKASDLVASDPTQAIELLDRALATDPDYPLAMGNKATALGRLGRFDEAAAQLAALQTKYPEMHKAALPRGIYLERAGQTDQARAVYQSAVEGLTQEIKRKPGNPELYCQRAYAYFLLGQTDEASKSLDAIERQLPDSPQVLSTRKLLMQSKRDDVVTTYGGALAGLPSAKKSPAPAAP